jgi:hypothetical protein
VATADPAGRNVMVTAEEEAGKGYPRDGAERADQDTAFLAVFFVGTNATRPRAKFFDYSPATTVAARPPVENRDAEPTSAIASLAPQPELQIVHERI